MKPSNLKRNLRFFILFVLVMVVWQLIFNTNLPNVFRAIDIRDNNSRAAQGVPFLDNEMQIPGQSDPGSWSLYRKRGFEFIRTDSTIPPQGVVHYSKYVYLEDNIIQWEKDKYNLQDSFLIVTSYRDGVDSDLPWEFSFGLEDKTSEIGFSESITVIDRWKINLPELVSRIENSLRKK
jgi:hypothetical protein